jgi:hypothetical protein
VAMINKEIGYMDETGTEHELTGNNHQSRQRQR